MKAHVGLLLTLAIGTPAFAQSISSPAGCILTVPCAASQITLNGNATLFGDAANTLGLHNGVNPQTFNVYGTTDGTLTNYERMFMRFSSGAFVFGTENGGTGSGRNLRIQVPASGAQILFAINGGDKWAMNSAGAIQPATDNANDLGSGSLRPRTVYAGTSIIPSKVTASGTAPGAASMKLEVVAGTNAGSCKLQAYAGTSTTPVTIVDNVGSGC